MLIRVAILPLSAKFARILQATDSAITEKAQGLLFVVWLHLQSRSGQPNTHIHLNLLNFSLRKDSTIGSLPGIRSTAAQRGNGHGSGHRNPIYEHAKEVGEVLSNSVRQELHRRGYATRDREDGIGFEVEGVSQELIDHFSTRRREVLDAAAKLEQEHRHHDINSAKLSKWAARSSRAKKPNVPVPIEQLRERWRQEIRDIETSRAREQEVPWYES